MPNSGRRTAHRDTIMLKLIPQQNLKPSPQGGVNLRPGDSVPNLAVPRKLAFHGFLANLKYLLTERHPRISDDAKGGLFLPQHSRASLVDNLKECFRPAPKFANDAVQSLTGTASPGIKTEPQPLYLSLFRHIRDIIVPTKLPPLELTSTPVQVPDIWSKQKAFSGSRAVSVFLHAALVAAALVWSVRQVTTLDAPKTTTVLIAPPYWALRLRRTQRRHRPQRRRRPRTGPRTQSGSHSSCRES